MKRILKYNLPILFFNEKFEVSIPKDYKKLRAEVQKQTTVDEESNIKTSNMPVLWVLADQTNDHVVYEFIFLPTGGYANDNHIYIDTFQLGPLVYHLFQIKT